jgi:hypothetical protein
LLTGFEVLYHTPAFDQNTISKGTAMDADALKKMTVAELREEAKKLGDVKGLATMKKDGLVALLSGGATAGGPGRTGPLSRGDLKQKIRSLKKERAAAAEKVQRAKVDEFNTALRRYRRKLRRAARHKAKP